MVTKALAGVNIGNVHFDRRYLGCHQGIVQGNGGVRVAARVDDNSSSLLAVSFVNVVDQFALAIGLSAVGLKAKMFGGLSRDPAAGKVLVPVIDPAGHRAGRQAVGYAAALLPTSLVPTIVNLSGNVYGVLAAVLGVALLVLSIRFARTRTNATARDLFIASLVYLPLIWIVMIVDKR